MLSSSRDMSVKTALPAVSGQLNDIGHVSLLPFALQYNGPAAISTYFACHSDGDAERSASRTGAFRGRVVVSNAVSVPEGYKGIICESLDPVIPVKKSTASAKRVASSSSAAASSGLKKRKIDSDGAVTTETTKKVLMTGVRRSPRKQKAVINYSLDDDDHDDDEDDNEDAADQEDTSHDGQQHLAPESDALMRDPVAVEPERQEELAMDYEEVQEVEVPSSRPMLGATVSMQSIPPTPLEEDTPLARDVKQLVPVATFDSVHIYHADYQGDLADDCYAKAMTEWLTVASKVRFVSAQSCEALFC